ncbi:MAG: hypothetical protein Q4A78_09855 [Peptostreptococcaceae bacterium]|nr:hypothetical protein [Peptostreptococcaceae bacterium]
MTKKDIVDIYLETGDFQEAVKKSGLPALIAHLKLLESGVLKIQDKIKYSSEAGKLGAMAEERFQELIPEAVDANKILKKNNPVFDFMYGNITIDVKFSSLHQRGKQAFWSANVRSQTSDVLVLFLESAKGMKLKNPLYLVIPSAFIRTKKIHISKNGDVFRSFCVKEEELKKILRRYESVFR